MCKSMTINSAVMIMEAKSEQEALYFCSSAAKQFMLPGYCHAVYVTLTRFHSIKRWSHRTFQSVTNTQVVDLH